MLGIIAKNQKEMFGATLYAKRDDDQGQYFEFYYVEDGYKDDEQHVANLLSDVEREKIATSWALDFSANQYVEINADMYRIDSIAVNRSAGRAGANRVARNVMTEYKLSLVKVANPKAVYSDG